MFGKVGISLSIVVLILILTAIAISFVKDLKLRRLIILAAAVVIVAVIILTIGLMNIFIRDEMFKPKELKTDHDMGDGCVTTRIDNFHVLIADNGSQHTIVYFHGRYGNMSIYRPIVGVCKELGVNLALCDYPGFGKSKGEASIESMIDSSVATYKFARQRFPSSRMIVWGESLGAVPAIHVANNCSKVRKLILMSAFSSLPEIANISRKFIPILKTFTICVDNLENLRSVRAPTMIIHSSTDSFIPKDCAIKLYNACINDKSELVMIKGDHSTPKFSEDAIERICKFIGIRTFNAPLIKRAMNSLGVVL